MTSLIHWQLSEWKMKRILDCLIVFSCREAKESAHVIQDVFNLKTDDDNNEVRWSTSRLEEDVMLKESILRDSTVLFPKGKHLLNIFEPKGEEETVRQSDYPSKVVMSVSKLRREHEPGDSVEHFEHDSSVKVTNSRLEMLLSFFANYSFWYTTVSQRSMHLCKRNNWTEFNSSIVKTTLHSSCKNVLQLSLRESLFERSHVWSIALS